MGRRLIQRIYTCDKCGKTPDDGEVMYEMGYEVWCIACCQEDEENN